MLLRKFAPFVLSFLVSSCAGPRTMYLGRIGEVPLYNENHFYHYERIGDTNYYMQGVSNNGFNARIKAEVCVAMLYNTYGFSLQNLKFVDGYGEIKFVIEPNEYERLIEMAPMRKFK